MTEVHKKRKGFEKMKKEDLISDCLNLNKLLLQLKDENAFLRQPNNKMVDNLIGKVNEKTSNQIHDNNKVQQLQQQSEIFYPKFIPRSTKTLILSDSTYKKSSSKRSEPKYSYTLLSFSKSSRLIQYCKTIPRLSQD